jgi:7-cyano-7-deazaguanine reductase
MGMYRGRKQSGKVFAILRQYFVGAPKDFIYHRKDIFPALLEEYQRQYPEDGVKNITGFDDGLRCLAGLKDGPLVKVDAGKYKLVRAIIKQDGVKFNAQYNKFFAKKGKEYKNMTTRNSQTKETEGLTKLGDHKTKYQYDNPTPDLLETFPNPYPNRDYLTEFVFTEFSSLCPKTGQPDFAVITVQYIPDKKCIETKSLKLYFLAYRQYGGFMEKIVNRILDDLVAVSDPRWMKVTGNFNARGGTLINVEAKYETD